MVIALNQSIEKALGVYRDKIDEIDAQILDLMHQRITAAKSILEIKSQVSEPIFYRSEREAQVLRRLQELNAGRIEKMAIERLFREIISITRSTEIALTVSVLGPSGTYTESAARQHFGNSIEIVPLATIDEIFRATETGHTQFAVVPVENSSEGGVNATLDRLINTSLSICGEINLEIHHNLMGRDSEATEVKTVYAHTQSLAQCKRWLSTYLKHAELAPVSSNAEAAKRVCDERNALAIAGTTAAELYGLKILAKNIEDEPGNTTRFLVLAKQPTPPSGHDKTSLLLSCRHRPGALFHLLKPLSQHKIDMTKIESRPSRTGLWEYVFFIDIKGHAEEEVVSKALAQLKEEAGLFKHLGSYPISR